MFKQKRESFRVEFPRSYYPLISINKNTYDVFDASEFGVKFYAKDQATYTLDQPVSAIISFPDGEEYELEAEVVRMETQFICIKLLTPIPLSKIRSAHLYLIQKFTDKIEVYKNQH